MSANKQPILFIIGKNGQVGSELVERVNELSVDAVSFGSSELDICNRAEVLKAISKYRPTIVINTAAYTAVDKAEHEPERAYAVNRDGVENLAIACKAQNIPLIHISTDYVFDGEKNGPYVKSDAPNPAGVYGASKYAGERILRATWDKHIILRVSWVFGKNGNNFVKTMLRLANERDELSIVDDQFAAPTPVDKIVTQLLRYALQDLSHFGLVHMESNPGVTRFEFAKKIFNQAEEAGLIAKKPILKAISSKDFQAGAARPANSKLSIGADEKNCFPITWDDSLAAMLKGMVIT